VQRHAMNVWQQHASGEEGATFLERLLSDNEVMGRISAEELREITSLEKHLAYVDEAYKRVGLEG